MFYYLDWTWLLIIPALFLSIYAQSKVNTMFKKYSKVHTRSGITGAQVAERILAEAGVDNVQVERSEKGGLSDHYDPKGKVIRLSAGVYDATSVSALGVAAHECGHAIQDKVGYFPNTLRTMFVPLAQLGSFASIPLFFIGLILSMEPLIFAGILFFALTTLFYVVTLPVEYNASSRAIAILGSGGYLESDELEGSRQVLSAAALTYLAAALMSMLQLLRLILLSNRRR